VKLQRSQSLELELLTGRRRRNVQTIRHRPASIIDTRQSVVNTAKYTMEAAKHNSASEIAHIFTRFDGRALFSFHSCIIGPNILERMSHAKNLSDDRVKQNAERRRKGVIGRPGSAMPTAPAVSDANPSVSHTARNIVGVRAWCSLSLPSSLLASSPTM